ncbi:hypothetical protein DKX38_009982 [Salix brachista]|uniref:Uncharacterized protein n=1 Tax=Salix brachista TaxID=2182728 RepID=A0A5N5MEM1_9ROSI|nr:hypothetical protein DKX38_009982 [Salix brachista]
MIASLPSAFMVFLLGVIWAFIRHDLCLLRLWDLFHCMYKSGCLDELMSCMSGADDQPDVAVTRSQLQSDVSLVRESEALRSELMKMKLYVSDMQKNQGSSTKGIAAAGSRKHTFFLSMSKTLGKLNPFKHGSKDTFHIDDNIGVDITKLRRFSIS